jgi:hypothetical protein
MPDLVSVDINGRLKAIKKPLAGLKACGKGRGIVELFGGF